MLRAVTGKIAFIPNEINEDRPVSHFEKSKEEYEHELLIKSCEYGVYTMIAGPDGEYIDQILVGYVKKTQDGWTYIPEGDSEFGMYTADVMADLGSTLSMLDRDQETMQ
ncbi:MAG: hypothetical protein ACXADS_15395 [Candidatus Thorarchaeota archaeon]|jgi:hypothetical protein